MMRVTEGLVMLTPLTGYRFSTTRHRPQRRYECTCCGERKPAMAFSPDARKRNGLHSHCRQCRNVARRRRYARKM